MQLVSVDRKMLNLFIDIQQTQSLQTAKTYRGTLEQFIEYVKKPMREVVLDDINEYAKTMSELAIATQCKKLTTLRSFFSFLSAQPNYLVANPLAAFKLPKQVKSDQVERILTKEEIEKIRAVLRYRNVRNWLIVSTLFATGLRISELCTAKWSDIITDLDDNIGLRVIGKGKKLRVVKLTKRLFNQIVSWRESEGLDCIIGSGDESPLFPNKRGGHITSRYIEQVVTEAAQLAGINKSVSPHWLRHSTATHALHNGANLLQVKEQLGHASINTTQVYLHTLNRLQETASDFIDME